MRACIGIQVKEKKENNIQNRRRVGGRGTGERGRGEGKEGVGGGGGKERKKIENIIPRIRYVAIVVNPFPPFPAKCPQKITDYVTSCLAVSL